jgi:hypothetical protein
MQTTKPQSEYFSTINYSKMSDPETFVPARMRGAYQRYIENGILPGSFGLAILSNDLKKAVGTADVENREHIASTVRWFFNYAPYHCWGSDEAVDFWLAMHATNAKTKEQGE